MSCISVNDEVVHGIPSAQTIIKEGDLVKVDVCAHSRDIVRIWRVHISLEHATKVSKVCGQCCTNALDKGIDQAIAGNRSF